MSSLQADHLAEEHRTLISPNEEPRQPKTTDSNHNNTVSNIIGANNNNTPADSLNEQNDSLLMSNDVIAMSHDNVEMNAAETLDDVTTNDDSNDSHTSVEDLKEDFKSGLDICQAPETEMVQSAPVTTQSQMNGDGSLENGISIVTPDNNNKPAIPKQAMAVHFLENDKIVEKAEIGIQAELMALKDVKLIVIHGMKDPLSTLHGFTFRWDGQTFDSVEQAFCFQKATENKRPDIAKEIRRSRHAGQAKSIGSKMTGGLSKAWLQQEPELMEAMLREKLKQSNVLRTRILATENALLVNATAKPGVDYVWASGLDVANTEKSRGVFPGKNLVGKILTKLRDELREGEKPCEAILVPQITTAPVFL